MAIDIAKPPREIQKRSVGPWVNILYYFFVLLLMVTIAASGILFFTITTMQSSIKATQQKIDQERTPERLEMEKQVVLAQKQIDDFSKLMARHKLNSRFFTELEGLTHPQVYFSGLDSQIQSGKVILSGVVNNFEILGEQFLIFKNKDYISNVSLVKAEVAEDGNLNFTAEVSFNASNFAF